MDARDDASRQGSRTSEDEVGEESSSDCGVSEISFSRELFLFSFAFLQIELQSLPLDLHESQMLGSKGVDVRDNPWISQMEKGVIDDDAAGGRGMKNGELRILNSCSEEICDRVRAGMEGNGIEGGRF